MKKVVPARALVCLPANQIRTCHKPPVCHARLYVGIPVQPRGASCHASARKAASRTRGKEVSMRLEELDSDLRADRAICLENRPIQAWGKSVPTA